MLTKLSHRINGYCEARVITFSKGKENIPDSKAIVAKENIHSVFQEHKLRFRKLPH